MEVVVEWQIETLLERLRMIRKGAAPGSLAARQGQA